MISKCRNEIGNEKDSSDDVPILEISRGSEIIKELVKSIQDPVSASLVHRHVCLFKNYILHSKENTLIRDVPYVSTVLNHLCCKHEEIPEYKGPMFHLLYILSKPPFLSKMSDCLHCKAILKDYFNILGGLLIKLVAEPFLQKCIFNIIHNLVTIEKTHNKSLVSHELCMDALLNSNLCKHLTRLVEMSPTYNVNELLHIIRDVIVETDTCWLQFMKFNLHNALMLKLVPECKRIGDASKGKSCPPVTTISILWLLYKSLQSNENQTELFDPPSTTAFRNVVNLLKDEIKSTGKILTSKSFRNSIATILLQCVQLFPEIEIDSENILEDLIKLSIIKPQYLEKLADDITLTNDQEDFTFHQIMLFTTWTVLLNLYNYKEFSSSNMKMKTEEIIVTLIGFLEPWQSYLTVMWQKNQVKEYLEAALRVIPLLLPNHASEFVKGYTGRRLMTLLSLFEYDTICVDLLLWVSRCLNRMCDFYYRQSKDDQNIMLLVETLVENRIQMMLILGICRRILYTDSLSQMFQKILTNLLFVLQLILAYRQGRDSRVDNSKLLEFVHSCLDRIIKPNKDDTIITNRLQVAFADFVWSFVNQAPENCENFIKTNGVYKILDVLHISLFPIKHIYLSMLVDMCSVDLKCLPYLLTWHCVKGHKKVGFLNLLCHWWRYQEVSDGVKRDQDGCIEDYERPIMGTNQWELFVKMSEVTSPAILNLIGNINPKIYSLVYFIEEKYKDITQLVQEQYQLRPEFPPEDELTLLVIRNYYNFKSGEIWQELDGDYTRHWPTLKIMPIYRDIIHKLVLKHLNLSLHVQTLQKKIIDKIKQENEDKEAQLFTIFNDSQIAPAMKGLRKICLNSRIENVEFLTEAKEATERMINEFRNKTGIHNAIQTCPRGLNITTMSAGRHKILMKKAENDFYFKNHHESRSTSLVSLDSENPSSHCAYDELYTSAVKVESLCQVQNTRKNKKKLKKKL